VLGVAEDWILQPEDPGEVTGYVPNVVFSCGAVPEADGSVKIYWGGADPVTCVGSARIDEIVDRCLDNGRKVTLAAGPQPVCAGSIDGTALGGRSRAMTIRSERALRRETANGGEHRGTSDLDVVALVAHELKHPLAAIEVALPLMADAAEPGTRTKARHTIERQLIYMRRLVNDLLDAERARRGDLCLEVVRLDLRSIVEDASRTFGELAKQRYVLFTKETPSAPVVVEGDRVRLQQVLSNVLENALKHTNAGETIEVRLRSGSRQATISVSDTGDGIPVDVLPHVFEPFQHHGNGGGLGIGLNVSRRLIELHGGEITARSAGLGKGAEFVLKLPIFNGVRKSASTRSS
jgi:signal transduction histidine kinase